METVTAEWLSAQRQRCYHRTPQLRIQTIEQARAFMNEIGFCHFWPIKGIEMPNLFHAIAGRVRSVPNAHDDPDLSKCWGWKDQALGQHWWFYAKVLRRRATLISHRMLPYFYACSKNYGDLEDYLQEYQDGTLSVEAKQVYEALLKHGPLDTIRLRREARMSAETAKSRFERALIELQVGFKVLPIGVAHVGAWRYAFIYELVPRHYPDLPARAREIGARQAREALITQYLDNVIGTDRGMVQRVFHVLNWTPAELNRTINTLLEKGAIRKAKIQGEDRPQLISTPALGSNAEQKV
jgi:hypothetical protein